jgi:hypothetical protein
VPISRKFEKNFIDQQIGLNVSGKDGIRKNGIRDPDQLFGMFTGVGGDKIMEQSRLLLYSRLTLPPASQSGSGPIVGQSVL